MWFCKVTSSGSINHQGCSIALVIRAAKSCYPCRSVLQTWFCFCNTICCIAASSKIFITYWPYINNSLLPYITYKAAIRFLSSLHQLLYFCLCRFFKVVLPFIFPRFFISGVGVCDFEPRLSNFVFALFALFSFGGWFANFFFHFL